MLHSMGELTREVLERTSAAKEEPGSVRNGDSPGNSSATNQTSENRRSSSSLQSCEERPSRDVSYQASESVRTR